MTKANIVTYLRRCSGAELIEILGAVLPIRPEARSGNGIQDLLVLCNAYRLEDRSSPYDDGWMFEPVADQYPGAYEGRESGEPFLQAGFCAACEVEVVSHVKRAQCPLCGSKVGCT